MAEYIITNVGANKRLNLYGSSVTELSIFNNQNITVWSSSNTDEQRWVIPRLGNGVFIRSKINRAFGLNAYRNSDIEFNCDVYRIYGNETDSKVNIILVGGRYRIQLANYPEYYLTASGSDDGANVYWKKGLDGTAFQTWGIQEIQGSANSPAYTYPTPNRQMSQWGGFSSSHLAIDVSDNSGTPIYAFADGVVAYTQNATANWSPNDSNPPFGNDSLETMGNCIAINHINPDSTLADGLYARTIYMHMLNNPTFAPGETVTKGQIIGYIGSTGRSSGPHLHFNLSVGSNDYLNPETNNKIWVSQGELPSIDPIRYLAEYAD